MTPEKSIQSGIIKKIINGTLTIDSFDEFESMLKIFPDSPELRRLFSDLLVEQQKQEEAIRSYRQAAEMFMNAGSVLQAIIAEMMIWRFDKPSTKAMKGFYNQLLEKNRRDSPLAVFLGDLSMPELFALISRMECIRLPPKRVVKKRGDLEKNLYLIASGAVSSEGLKDVSQRDTDGMKERRITEAEFFGEVCPLTELKISQRTTETLTQSELIKISKENLVSIAKLFPAFEDNLKALFRNRKVLLKSIQGERRSQRQSVPVRMKMAIEQFPGEDPPMVIRGTVKDMSVGGVSVLLDEDSATSVNRPLNQQVVELQMSHPSEAMTVAVRGRIIWEQKVSLESTTQTRALGIRFQELPPNLSGLLMVFAGNLTHPV